MKTHAMIGWVSRLWRGSTPARRARRGAVPVADLLWEHAGGALVAVDRRGRICDVNGVARALLAGAVERHDPVLPLFAAEARDRVWAEIVAAMPGGPPQAPMRVALAAGAAVAVTVVPLASGVLLRLRDLRREHELEALLSRAQEPPALGQFAGGVAHDLNNLLAAILGAAEAIAGQDGLSAEVAEDAAQIRASAERGSQLVRRLLASGHEQAAHPRRVAVAAAVAGLSSTLRRLLGGAILLELDTDVDAAGNGDAAPHVVMVDPVELDRVLVNLVVNARDAMPTGGELRIASRAVTLRHACAIAGGACVGAPGGNTVPPGRWVTIDVLDGGVGIAPETLPRVLEPFFTTRREQGGSGLGLSTVHGIVRRCGGFLAIESTVGVGTCVRVWLPRGDDLSEPPSPMASATLSRAEMPDQTPFHMPGQMPGRTVLLVDDEEPVRRLAERALARQGWRVLAADSAEAALAALDAEPAGSTPLAAMVSDIVMPGLDGAGLVERVRARAGQAALPVVLVSGYSDTSLDAALGDRPPTVFLPKPYTLGELVSRVAALAGPPPPP